ncbi:MAG: phosphate starvation-inducible protein PhoH, partial [Clostridiaceae bacterium]|nr:phosphate starvation-inducible protein PhoH [Clostridiaceae bacterium]
MDTVVERQIELPAPEQLANVFGTNDKNIKIIEDRLEVRITTRNNELHVSGFESRADRAVDVLQKLLLISEQGNIITEQNVRYLLELSDEERL